MAKRGSSKSKKTESPMKKVVAVSWQNLVKFFSIFVVAYVIDWFAADEFLSTLFGIIWMIFLFLSIALFIVLMVLLIIKPKR